MSDPASPDRPLARSALARYGPVLLLLAAVGASAALFLTADEDAPPVQGDLASSSPPFQTNLVAGTEAELSVYSEPAGAEVYVDGEPVGYTPLRQETLPPGVYVLSVLPAEGLGVDTFVVLDEATPQTFSFSFDPAPSGRVAEQPETDAAATRTPEPAQLRDREPARERPARRTGRLVVTSEPAGAAVWVDGTRIGEAPVVLSDLGAGEHDVILWLEGFEPFVATAEVEGGGVRSVRATFGAPSEGTPSEGARTDGDTPEPIPTDGLAADVGRPGRAPSAARPPTSSQPAADSQPAAEAASAHLSVLVRPWGSIYVDGALYEPNTNIRHTLSLPPGLHTVRVVHPGFGSETREVRLAPGAAERLVFDLTPPEAPTVATEPPPSTTPEPVAPPPEPAAPSASGTSESGGIYAASEEPPRLVGGLERLQRSIRYPPEAYDAKVEGRVYVQFVVDAEGRVQDPEVVRGLPHGANAEALRVIRSARFRPGRVGGRAVAVRHSLYLTFEIL